MFIFLTAQVTVQIGNNNMWKS